MVRNQVQGKLTTRNKIQKTKVHLKIVSNISSCKNNIIFGILWELILRWGNDSEKYDEEQLKMKIINAIKDQGLLFISIAMNSSYDVVYRFSRPKNIFWHQHHRTSSYFVSLWIMIWPKLYVFIRVS